MIRRLTISSPTGPLTLSEEDGALTRIEFGAPRAAGRQRDAASAADGPAMTDNPADYGASPLLERAAMQLEEYFAGRRREFDLPLSPAGTRFQLDVWRALREIPYGQTRSYKQIAAAVGRPLAARAVGMANNRNPLPIVVPCHRVIGASGALVGYASGLDIKRLLLDIEGIA